MRLQKFRGGMMLVRKSEIDRLIIKFIIDWGASIDDIVR